jgi:DNA end-binding protein Ku
MAGLARVVLTRREHVVMLEPFDKGLLATTLRYPYEIRDHADYFGELPELKLPAEMMKLAGHIVDTKAGHFDPKKFEDHYEQALVSLLKSKEAGRPVETIGEEKSAPRVINLMDALKASINASAKKPAAASTGERRPAKKKASAR